MSVINGDEVTVKLVGESNGVPADCRNEGVGVTG